MELKSFGTIAAASLIAAGLAGTAVPATLILLIQTVLLFAGGAFDSDGDAGVPDADGPDFDGPDADGGPLHEAAADPETPDTGLHLFTVRGVVAFLVLFGWGGLWLHQVGLPGFLAVFLAIPIGFAGMVGIALAVRQALRLQYDGTLDLRNALGRTGTVYLTVQEQLTEFEALTDSPAPIPTGSPVRVTGLAGRGALLVEPIPSESKETE